MKKTIFFLIFCMCFVSFFALELTIFHTNDHHGSLFSYWYEIYEVAGLAERVSLIRQLTESHENVLLLDAGDFNTGVYESNLFRAEPDIIAYNLIGYDALTLGNHEFYGGLERIRQQIEWADFPMLSANIFTLEGELVGLPYTTFTMQNGLLVAVFGLTTTHKQLHNDFVVKNDIEIALELVPRLREKADIVIALTHLGIYDLGVDELYGSIRLAYNVPGIDLIIDGDSHTVLEEPAYVNGIPIVQAGERGKYVGKAELSFDVMTGKVSLSNWETIPLMREFNDPPFEVDNEVFEAIEVFKQRAIEMGNDLLGHSERYFRDIGVRNRITALGRVVSEAMLNATIEYGAEVAMTNSGSIRSNLRAGEVRISDIHNILPFDNDLVVVEIPGTVLLDIITVSFLEKVDTGAFLQYSNNVGIIQRPPNLVIPNLRGIEIEPDRIYRVVTNSFLADGGDGYSQFEYALDTINTGITVREALIHYIQTNEFFRATEVTE
ncbi:MAG: 5'-nucleotidase C-terminal domain-containing protein [Candidatus Cloacimonetes bacterium]|nr:5'-nucleotidase C-terminal domain-containing protein [Candidatus Cloacimonadota bacterium]